MGGDALLLSCLRATQRAALVHDQPLHNAKYSMAMIAEAPSSSAFRFCFPRALLTYFGKPIWGTEPRWGDSFFLQAIFPNSEHFPVGASPTPPNWRTTISLDRNWGLFPHNK